MRVSELKSLASLQRRSRLLAVQPGLARSGQVRSRRSVSVTYRGSAFWMAGRPPVPKLQELNNGVQCSDSFSAQVTVFSCEHAFEVALESGLMRW